MQPRDVTDAGDRVAFFVDAANVDKAARELGFSIDWRKALDHFRGNGRFAGAFYFTAERRDNEGHARFLHEMAEKGFVVREKPLKEIHDEEGNVIRKANVDVELALEMVATMDNYDVAYLFSGDSDFQRVVEVLQARGKRVHVVSSERTLSRELLRIASKPVYYLGDLKDTLAWKD